MKSPWYWRHGQVSSGSGKMINIPWCWRHSQQCLVVLESLSTVHGTGDMVNSLQVLAK